MGKQSIAAEPSPARDYFELAERAQSGSTTITGVLAKSAPRFGPHGCIPLLWCFCVHDSPDSPCPCMGPLVWIPERFIKHARATSRFSSSFGERQPLLAFELPIDTEIFVDDSIRCRPNQNDGLRAYQVSEDGVMEPLEAEVLIPRFTPIGVGDLSHTVTLVHEKRGLDQISLKFGWGPLGHLGQAFKLGWAFGRGLAHAFDLDDKLSDWLLKTLGPRGGQK